MTYLRNIAAAALCTVVAATPAFATPLEPGSPDPGFRVGKGFTSEYPPTAVEAIAEEPSSGKVLVGGWFTKYRGQDAPGIARLNKHGKLDTTFDPGQGPNGPVLAILPLPSGKFLVAGSFTEYDGYRSGNLVRLNSDGSLDESYRGGRFNSEVQALTALPNGDVLAAGIFSYFGNKYVPSGVIRLNPNGTRDETFKPRRLSPTGQVMSVLPAGKGRLLLGGTFTRYAGKSRPGLVRVKANGALDKSFRPGAGISASEGGSPGVYSLAAVRGGYIVGGAFESYRGSSALNLVAVRRSGARDRRFKVGEGFSGQVNDISLQGKKVIAVGNFATYRGEEANGIVRLSRKGELDRTFKSGQGFSGSVTDSLLRGDGTLLVGGFFVTYKGIPSPKLVGVLTE